MDGWSWEATDQDLWQTFKNYKEERIDGLMYNGGHNPETYKRVGKLWKNAGDGIPYLVTTMVQG